MAPSSTEAPFPILCDIFDPPAIPPELDNRRLEQIAPDGDWRVWLLHPGRRWGKGYTLSRWIVDGVRDGSGRSIALAGSTTTAVRQLMIEHPTSGILAVDPSARWLPGKGEIHWANGAKAFVCTAENADKPPLRGGGFDRGWADEVDSWGDDTTNKKANRAWENLTLSMSAGDSRLGVSSTPKAGRIVAELVQRAKDDGDVAITTGSTYDNAANLSAQYIEMLERRYKGTSLEAREIHGIIPAGIAGALWHPESFTNRKIKTAALLRVVIGVDPSGGADLIGIVAAGELAPELWVVLDDWSCAGSPAKWAGRVADLADKWAADLVVAESNFGGDMVLSTLKNAQSDLPVRLVNASRGKHVRAEPISLLYEQGKVLHRRGPDAAFEFVEEELRHMTATGYEGGGSPNRADALVWALTELSKGKSTWGVA